ncbi:transposase [Bradyrhizobium sp. SZCCHNR2035]|uniref:IS66 family transposase n=1 Tax=Bradyrhizobium sp. SZCCHNR2035 TaxID=3057386 RepID=UPI0039672C3C
MKASPEAYSVRSGSQAERPVAHLAAFKGILHVDGYLGFEQLTNKEGITLVACWSHSRRSSTT